jgi:hypothetical protein
MKRSKRPDGFYGWHVFGSLKAPKFEPSTSDSKTKGLGSKPGRRNWAQVARRKIERGLL